MINLKDIPLIAHPNIFDAKIDEDKIHYGCPITKDELENICKSMLETGVKPDTPVYPCHCCDLKSKIIMSKFFDVKEVCVGDVILVPTF